MSYAKFLNPSTPQNQPARPDQTPNHAGGYAFDVTPWQQLERFLILGSVAGTYYVAAKDLTTENIGVIETCLKLDGPRAVQMAVDISQQGRAIKNDPAILVLAVATTSKDDSLKQQVRQSINAVCRTGTHILHFVAYADALRKWGRALRNTVKAWYENQDVNRLAYQMVKYQSRDKWAHADLIRLSHVGSDDPDRKALYDWALHGKREGVTYPKIVDAFEEAKTALPARIVSLIETSDLSREMIPTDKLNDPAVAKALALHSPITALIRNLGNFTKLGLLAPQEGVLEHILTQLRSKEALNRGRVHPIDILLALKTYASGHGVRGQSTWSPVPQVIDALNDAFYLACETVEPMRKRLLLAVDCSGSMHSEITLTPGFSAAQASTAMALVTARTEPLYSTVAFGTAVHEWSISPKQRLDDVLRSLPNGGGTDVAAPIRWAAEKKLNVDAILIYTDSETWAGNTHPYQAMNQYRKAINSNARLMILATAATKISVAAPDDPQSLTVVGFDASVPEVIRTFVG